MVEFDARREIRAQIDEDIEPGLPTAGRQERKGARYEHHPRSRASHSF